MCYTYVSLHIDVLQYEQQKGEVSDLKAALATAQQALAAAQATTPSSPQPPPPPPPPTSLGVEPTCAVALLPPATDAGASRSRSYMEGGFILCCMTAHCDSLLKHHSTTWVLLLLLLLWMHGWRITS